jgi:hypothetical protein
MTSLNLFREYLRLILISEGKVEDLAKQNPNVPVIDLASSDSTPTKKLLQNESDEEMKEILSDLISGKARLGINIALIAWKNANRQFHRDNDKPAIIYANGIKGWYKNGIKYSPKK